MGRRENKCLAIISADKRPVRKRYRPYRNRAIVYALIETGTRRAAAAKVNLLDVDFDKHAVSVEEKGGVFHTYKIIGEGLQAIRDYMDKERTIDVEQFKESPHPVPAGAYHTKPRWPAQRECDQSDLE